LEFGLHLPAFQSLISFSEFSVFTHADISHLAFSSHICVYIVEIFLDTCTVISYIHDTEECEHLCRGSPKCSTCVVLAAFTSPSCEYYSADLFFCSNT